MRFIAILIICLMSISFSSCQTLRHSDIKDRPDSSIVKDYQHLEIVSEECNTHSVAEVPQTVSDPISGYCGNMVTKIIYQEREYSFSGEDSVALTDMLINLNYNKPMCKCAAEFEVAVETEEAMYAVNLRSAFVRFCGKHAELTDEQIDTIQKIYDRHVLNKEAVE